MLKRTDQTGRLKAHRMMNMRDESGVGNVAGKGGVVALLTAGEVAEMLQVSRQRVYELGREGVIPCVRIGRQVRFDEAAFHEWVAGGGSTEKRHSPDWEPGR